MTKGSQIDLSSKSEKDDNHSSRRSKNPILLSSHTISDPTLHTFSEKKAPKKSKRKTSITASKTTIGGGEKKKKLNFTDKNNQKTLSSNLARLAPLLHRSCPDSLLQVESLKADKQDSNKENASFQFTALDAPAPRPQRFQGGTSKRLQIFERQKKKKSNTNTSNTVTQDTTPIEFSFERNNSSPNLLLPTLCEKSKRFQPLLTSFSQTLTSEFPNVAQFYQNDFLQTSNNKLPQYLRSASGSRARKTNLNLTPSLVLRKTQLAYSPYPKTLLSWSSSSQSAPSTPPNFPQSGKIRKGRLHLPLGAAVSCNSFQSLTSAELASLSIGLAENTAKVLSDTSSTAARDEDKSRQLSDDTLSLFASVKKAMNSKSNHQVSANSKNAQPQQPLLQYHTNRPRPRIANNFSSSFILPYGLGGRVQSSPVSNPAVPCSSSFHGGPLESLQLMSENHRSTVRQQSQCSNGQRQQRKFLERQKMKMLKPLGVNKNQNNIAKLYDISTSEFSAAILPDTGTMSYRLTHDVSFDEGSRYRTTDFPHGFKGKDDSRFQQMNINGLTHQFGSSVSMRGNEVSGATSQARRDHASSNNSNNIAFKDTVPLSLIRMEDRCDLPPATSPSSPALSSAIAASASTSSFIPPPSASRPNPTSATAISGGNITFRLHKEKQNWNYRLGELSINGGGYTNSISAGANAKQEFDAINPINVTSAVQRNLQTRERAMAAFPKSRLSSRYNSKFDSANGAAPSYSDPCISAPPSFQQRLTDLSILESDTIKYERNRKLRRKKNQDKDS